jgi:hypothetical protein
MRHIPEDELHAYLDQGLSRSQCVEIESHLAACPSCRATRDAIAALRDRTTALLSALAPPRRVPPAFETLRGLAAARVSTRRRRLRAAAWAASLVAAVGLGWTASAVVRPGHPASVASREIPPAPASSRPQAPADSATVRSGSTEPERAEAATPTPVRYEARSEEARREEARRDEGRRDAEAPGEARKAREDSLREAKLAVIDPAPVLELTPLESRTPDQLDGMWRTMSWDGAQSETGSSVPHIDGLPVLRVQVQANDQGKRPLMVVAQQLASGEVIQTIEGDAADVSQLLSRRTATASAGGLSVTVTEAGPTPDQAMAMQRGDRMIAITGALPSDSLRAMIRRINAEMRSK